MKVFVVGKRGYWDSFSDMYSNNGFGVVDTLEASDIVQFTGGEDVTPRYYGEHKHPFTSHNVHRDEYEEVIYRQAQALGKFCVGVCRGGQFLNVMNGGTMYQHVGGHAQFGGHHLRDLLTDKEYAVTSTHHQMMRKGSEGILVAQASKVLSPVKEFMTTTKDKPSIIQVEDEVEVESVYYPITRSLCYQPHPEYVSQDHDCQRYFFSLLNRYV